MVGGLPRLLRARRERPRHRRAAEQRDEFAPLHSITSSARASSLIDRCNFPPQAGVISPGLVMSLFQLFSAFGDVLEKFGDRPVHELDIGGLGRRGSDGITT